ncbi:MAG: 8-oxo-dGTP diphosphatase [Clostridia bacterium]|nr:8-oxo-dGTP diphosphatase [Clostridia bacterium]
MKDTTLCYIEKDNKYLMIYRNKKKNDVNEGKYVGIGGHIENGETLEECIIREAKEETGLTIINPKYRGIITFISNVYEEERMHLFTCTSFEGELTTCNEGELEWIDKSRLEQIPMWSGDIIFLKMLDTERDFFKLTLTYENDDLISSELTK